MEYDERRFWKEESWRKEDVLFHFDESDCDECGREHGSEYWEDGSDVGNPATSSDDELSRLPFHPTFITRTFSLLPTTFIILSTTSGTNR